MKKILKQKLLVCYSLCCLVAFMMTFSSCNKDEYNDSLAGNSYKRTWEEFPDNTAIGGTAYMIYTFISETEWRWERYRTDEFAQWQTNTGSGKYCYSKKENKGYFTSFSTYSTCPKSDFNKLEPDFYIEGGDLYARDRVNGYFLDYIRFNKQ